MNDFAQGLIVIACCLVFVGILQIIKLAIKKKLREQNNIDINLMSDKADYEEYLRVNDKTLRN